MKIRRGWIVTCSVWIAACGGCGPNAKPGPGDGGSTAGKPTREAAMREIPGPDSLASVEQVLAAGSIRPDESLAVHLRGTVGADGSWALEQIEVRPVQGGALVVPRVRRVPGDMFIQMVIPLEATVRLALPPGKQRIEVLGRDGAMAIDVEVTPAAHRAAPVVRLEAAPAIDVQDAAVVPLHVEATIADGWVERVELREVTAGTNGAWQAPEMVEPAPAGLRATFSLRRPAGDAARRIEVRAVDGQGAVSEPTGIDLPAR